MMILPETLPRLFTAASVAGQGVASTMISAFCAASGGVKAGNERYLGSAGSGTPNTTFSPAADQPRASAEPTLPAPIIAILIAISSLPGFQTFKLASHCCLLHLVIQPVKPEAPRCKNAIWWWDLVVTGGGSLPAAEFALLSTREGHARFWERPEVKFLRATRQRQRSSTWARTSALPQEADQSAVKQIVSGVPEAATLHAAPAATPSSTDPTFKSIRAATENCR